MRTPPFSHKVHSSTGSDTLDKKPRQSNDSTIHRTKDSIDSHHKKPIIVNRRVLLSKFPPIFRKTTLKDAGHLNIQLLHPPTDKPAPGLSPTTSCFTNDSDPFRRPSPVQPTPPNEQLISSISLPPPQTYEPMTLCDCVPEMLDIIQGATRISSTNPIRAFHMPTGWAPRTTQMDADPFSHPSQDNPLKIVIESGPLVTSRLKSTTALPVEPEIHHSAYGITTPPCSPEHPAFETGDCFGAHPNCSGLNHSTTPENSFDGISEDKTWRYALYSRKHRGLKNVKRGETWLLVRTS